MQWQEMVIVTRGFPQVCRCSPKLSCVSSHHIITGPLIPFGRFCNSTQSVISVGIILVGHRRTLCVKQVTELQNGVYKSQGVFQYKCGGGIVFAYIPFDIWPVRGRESFVVGNPRLLVKYVKWSVWSGWWRDSAKGRGNILKEWLAMWVRLQTMDILV